MSLNPFLKCMGCQFILYYITLFFMKSLYFYKYLVFSHIVNFELSGKRYGRFPLSIRVSLAVTLKFQSLFVFSHIFGQWLRRNVIVQFKSEVVLVVQTGLIHNSMVVRFHESKIAAFGSILNFYYYHIIQTLSLCLFEIILVCSIPCSKSHQIIYCRFK